MRSLLAEEAVRRYNADDVIIIQDAETRGFVYLILTGYCDVVLHDGKQFHTVAALQAGDIIAEMAIISGASTRNAKVVARTPSVYLPKRPSLPLSKQKAFEINCSIDGRYGQLLRTSYNSMK